MHWQLKRVRASRTIGIGILSFVGIVFVILLFEPTDIILYLPFAAVFTWIGIRLLRVTASQRSKLAELVTVQATVTEVLPPQPPSIYWNVSATWKDPADGTEHHFRSPFFYGKHYKVNRRLVEVGGPKKIDVLLDPKNPEHYFMDIEFPGSRWWTYD